MFATAIVFLCKLKQAVSYETKVTAHETVVAWEREISDYQEQADMWMEDYQQQLTAKVEADEEARRVQQRLEATISESNRRLTTKSS